MTTFIEYHEGKVYDTAHLRPFDRKWAKAGHPLAWRDGGEVSHIFPYRKIQVRTEICVVRHWDLASNFWATHGLVKSMESCKLRLAPLAIKDGRALHVGDEYQIGYTNVLFGEKVIQYHKVRAEIHDEFNCWRFADEVTK